MHHLVGVISHVEFHAYQSILTGASNMIPFVVGVQPVEWNKLLIHWSLGDLNEILEKK